MSFFQRVSEATAVMNEQKTFWVLSSLDIPLLIWDQVFTKGVAVKIKPDTQRNWTRGNLKNSSIK